MWAQPERQIVSRIDSCVTFGSVAPGVRAESGMPLWPAAPNATRQMTAFKARVIRRCMCSLSEVVRYADPGLDGAPLQPPLSCLAKADRFDCVVLTRRKRMALYDKDVIGTQSVAGCCPFQLAELRVPADERVLAVEFCSAC